MNNVSIDQSMNTVRNFVTSVVAFGPVQGFLSHGEGEPAAMPGRGR